MVTAVKDIKKNDIFTEKNIFPLRPYNGEYKVKDYKQFTEKKGCTKYKSWNSN